MRASSTRSRNSKRGRTSQCHNRRGSFLVGQFRRPMERDDASTRRQEQLSIGESARMFALANLAVADAAIAAWEAKVFYNFWRPSTAIHEGDDDPNRRTQGDVTWTALFGPDPLYPTTSRARTA